MRKTTLLASGLVIALAVSACAGEPPGTLPAANTALGTADTNAIEYLGHRPVVPVRPGPQSHAALAGVRPEEFHGPYRLRGPAAQVQMERIQVVEPDRARPTPGPATCRADREWLAGLEPGRRQPARRRALAPAPQPQPAAVDERTMEIWTTPHGFLKAAAANNATSQPVEGGSEVSFTHDGKYRYVGRINARNEVERVQTWIDNPILGDTPVEFAYSDYRDFGGIRFPGRIVRTQGGYPVLELTVSSVVKNPAVEIAVPDPVRSYAAPAVNVAVEKLANGVYYLRGGSHHSVAIDQADHVVVIEAPQDECARRRSSPRSRRPFRTSQSDTSSTPTSTSTTPAACAPTSPRGRPLSRTK